MELTYEHPALFFRLVCSITVQGGGGGGQKKEQDCGIGISNEGSVFLEARKNSQQWIDYLKR